MMTTMATGGFTLVVVLTQLAHAVPVPAPEELHRPAEYGQTRQMVAAVQPADEPVPAADAVTAERAAAAVRPARSPSPFFGIITGGYEPYKKQHHHHYQYHHHEEPEPAHHRPQYHKPQHHGGGQAGSFASAGSFAGGHGGGHSQSQSSANSQSASFGFGPFQASYSASSAQSGSHSGARSPDYY